MCAAGSARVLAARCSGAGGLTAPSLRNPTQKGQQQAEALRGNPLLSEALDDETLVVVSPLRRTLQVQLCVPLLSSVFVHERTCPGLRQVAC